MIRFKEFFDGIKNFFNYGIDDKKIIGQGNQTDALVESVKICWWITADKPIKLIPLKIKGENFIILSRSDMLLMKLNIHPKK